MANGYTQFLYGFWPIFPIQNPQNVPSSDQPTADGLHRKMITIFPCDSRRSKWVPSGSACLLRLLVGELGTLKLAEIFAYGKWLYIYIMLLTGRQIIWTKDIWKRAILRTNELSHQISSHLPAKSPKNPILGELSMRNILYRELSVSRTLMEVRRWNFTVI